jgi:hypothetical protein
MIADIFSSFILYLLENEKDYAQPPIAAAEPVVSSD